MNRIQRTVGAQRAVEFGRASGLAVTKFGPSVHSLLSKVGVRGAESSQGNQHGGKKQRRRQVDYLPADVWAKMNTEERKAHRKRTVLPKTGV